MADFANVSDVGEQLMQIGLAEWAAAAFVPLAGRPAFAGPASAAQFVGNRQQRLMFQVEIEDSPDSGGLVLVDDQLESLRVNVVAEDGMAADPLAFAASGGDLVAGAFADQFAFELGERHEDVEHEPAHGRGRVDLLREGDKRDMMLVEDFHHLGEVEQRAAEPITL